MRENFHRKCWYSIFFKCRFIFKIVSTVIYLPDLGKADEISKFFSWAASKAFLVNIGSIVFNFCLPVLELPVQKFVLLKVLEIAALLIFKNEFLYFFVLICFNLLRIWHVIRTHAIWSV